MSRFILLASALLAAQCAAKPKPFQRLPHVSSEALQSLISLDELVGGVKQLQDFAYAYPERNRVFGGQAHNDTIFYLYDALSATGYYDVQLQEFVELYAGGNASLTTNGEVQDPLVFSYSPGGSMTAPLVAVENLGCEAADYPPQASGNVVLISRGDCYFSEKALLAKAAGAEGAIIYNNVPGPFPGGTLQSVDDFAPSVSITQEEGEALLALLEAGTEVTVNLEVDAVFENRTTYNVLAETKCGDHNNVIALGGHTDSVDAGPGIDDNGSGTIALLNVALALTNFSTTNAVRFLWFSAEELGSFGAFYYVNQLNESATELAKLRAYLNFDMLASANYVYGILDGDGDDADEEEEEDLSGPPGSPEIEANFETFFASKGLNFTSFALDGSSDYEPFMGIDIAVGGLFTGANERKTEEEVEAFGGTVDEAFDPYYHLASDTVEHLSLEAFFVNTQAIADAVAMYATSLDGIPRREPTKAKRQSPPSIKSRAATHAHQSRSNSKRPPTA